MKVANDPIHGDPYPPQYANSYVPEYNAAQAGPVSYVPATGFFEPTIQQTAAPIASRGPSLPGATRYAQKQASHSITPPPRDIRPPSTRAHEHMAPERYAPPPPARDLKRRRTDEDYEHQTSRDLYPSLPQPSSATSALPIGTQHNPLEIPSSPDAPKIQSSKRKKKKHFYAVAAGHVPGIYKDYDTEVKPQIAGFPGAKHQGFATEAEARAWFGQHRSTSSTNATHPQSTSIPPMAGTTPNSVPYTEPNAPPEDASAKQAPVQSERMDSGLTSDVPVFMPLPSPPSSRVAAPPRIVQSPPDLEPVLTLEQQNVVDLILEGHNVFYTGSAGCGKSTILKAFVKKLYERGKTVTIVAPTNLAALNVGGVTTWSFAGWTPDSLKKPLDKLMADAHGDQIWERLNYPDVLVIDEISMVENLMFERLNHIMKAARGDAHADRPFGGVQMVVTGDVSQRRKH